MHICEKCAHIVPMGKVSIEILSVQNGNATAKVLVDGEDIGNGPIILYPGVTLDITAPQTLELSGPVTASFQTCPTCHGFTQKPIGEDAHAQEKVPSEV